MDTKTRIRQAAFALFSEVGFEAAPVAEICRKAGVSNGSFFHAYASKDALAGDLYLAALRRYHGALADAIRSGPGAAEGLAALLRAHLEWVVEDRDASMFLFEQARAAWMAHIRERQEAENLSFGQTFSAWAQPLIADGALADLPAPILIAQLIGPAQVVCRAWLAGRDSESPIRHADQLIECATRALLR